MPIGKRIQPAAIAVGVLVLLLSIGGCMLKMPGKSYSGPLPEPTPQELDLANRLHAHVHTLASVIGERNIWQYQALQASAQYITSQWQQMGLQVRTQAYSVMGKDVENLEAQIKGTENPEQILIVGAHYDSVRASPGANDNGTGIAAVLELTRQFKDKKPAGTIRFVAFVNEEPPFFHTPEMGSWVYARRCKQRGENVVAMLALETIGCYSDAKNSQSYPLSILGWMYPTTGNFIGFAGNFKSRALVKQCVGSFRSHTQFPSEAIAISDAIAGVGWSDHWSFWQEGFPAVMVTDTAPYRYRHYHTPQDTPQNIDYHRMARVVAGLGRVLEELVGASRTAGLRRQTP